MISKKKQKTARSKALKTAIGYVRVSKDAENKESPSVQKKKIKEFCAQKKWSLKTVYEDRGISGESIEKRPDMLQVIEEVKNKTTDAVVARYSDRAFRNREEAEWFANLCLSKEVDLEFVDGSYNWREHSGRLLYRVKSDFDQYLREAIGQNTKDSKILLAEEKADPAGRKPWGRTFSKEKGWGLDPEKKILIRDIAKRFLAGESLSKIALENKEKAKTEPELYKGICGYSSLLRVLKDRSGPDWYRTFYDYYTGKVDKRIRIQVPELLKPKIRKAILEKIEENKTFNGERKYHYLLKGHIFCASCGSPLVGEPSRWGKRYYRHRWPKNKCPHFFNSVRADVIEEPVILELYRAFGDTKRIEAAVKSAIPDPEERERLLKDRAVHEGVMKKIEEKIDRAMDFLLEKKMDEALFKMKIEKLKVQRAEAEKKIKAIDEKLSAVPEVPDEFTRIQLAMKKRFFRTLGHLRKMSYEEFREMIKALLGGKDSEGNRYGVYMKKSQKGHWVYELRGVLIPEKLKGAAPMDSEHKSKVLGYEDLDDGTVFVTALEHER